MHNRKISEELSSPYQILELQQDFFHQLRGQGRSANTLKNYKTDLGCFNEFLKKNFIDLNIQNIGPSEVQSYGDYLQTKYSSDNSRRRRVQALRRFFDYLVSKGIVADNFVKKIAISPKFLDIPRPTPFSHIKTLWEYLLKESDTLDPLPSLLAKRGQISILLVYGAGLKISDLSQLRREHIFIRKEPRVLVNHPKRDPYTIPLPQIFSTIYNNYLKALEKEKRVSEIKFDHILFNANPFKILRGGLSGRGLELVFADFRKKLDIEVTPKSLRQACIFKWIQKGHSDSLIKEWLGVAPNYSLKIYRDHNDQFIYSDEFLEELYFSFKKNGYP